MPHAASKKMVSKVDCVLKCHMFSQFFHQVY